jgi:hypothetical protein
VLPQGLGAGQVSTIPTHRGAKTLFFAFSVVKVPKIDTPPPPFPPPPPKFVSWTRNEPSDPGKVQATTGLKRKAEADRPTASVVVSGANERHSAWLSKRLIGHNRVAWKNVVMHRASSVKLIKELDAIIHINTAWDGLCAIRYDASATQWQLSNWRTEGGEIISN